MTFLPAILAAVAILPSDRMALADRLFDKGDYATAQAEYEALRGEKSISEDKLLYRLAETAYAMGDAAAARKLYGEMLAVNPASASAPRAKLVMALTGTDEEKKREFAALEGDDVPLEVRVPALYHGGVLRKDPERLLKCAKLAPDGPYAIPARMKRAAILSESEEQSKRRMAVGEFAELSFLPDRRRAAEALYMAIRCCYSDARYAEASTLSSRYLKSDPKGDFAPQVRLMAAWSYYRLGKYSTAETYATGVKGDDFDYLRGASAYASGELDRAKALFTEYLENHPEGRYRKAAELPLARMDYDKASSEGDSAKLVEAARRSAALSGSSGDRLRYAWALESAGRTAEAISEYDGVAEAFPDSEDGAEALFRMALAEARAGDWQAVGRTLERMPMGKAGEKRRAESLYWRGVAMARVGSRDSAAALLKEALEAGLPEAEALEARLLLANRERRLGFEALARTGEAAAKENLLRAQKEYSSLVAAGEAARMGAKDLRDVASLLLDSRWGASDLEAAAKCAEALVDSGAGGAWKELAFILLARSREAAGRKYEAAEAYRKAIAVSAKAGMVAELPRAVLALGTIEMELGEREKADATLESAVALLSGDHPARAKAYLALAKNAKESGRTADARRFATIVESLFSDKGETAASVADAKEILKSLPEEAK